MKIFYCSSCKRYYATAIAKISFIDTVQIHSDGTFWLADECDYDEVMAEKFTCPGYEDHVMEVVELDACPHEWRSSGYGYRECALCGQRDKGRVIFDD